MRTIGFTGALIGLTYCPKCKVVYHCKDECDCDSKKESWFDQKIDISSLIEDDSDNVQIVQIWKDPKIIEIARKTAPILFNINNRQENTSIGAIPKHDGKAKLSGGVKSTADESSPIADSTSVQEAS
jgi:hypothetical protein